MTAKSKTMAARFIWPRSITLVPGQRAPIPQSAGPAVANIKTLASWHSGRSADLHCEDRAGGQIRKIARALRIVSRIFCVGEVINKGVQREVVEVGEQAAAGIPPVARGEIVEIDLAIRSGNERLISHVLVVQ